MARKKQYQTRLDPDTADKVDTYAEQQDVTKAEALRRLVAHGLDHADEEAMTAAEIREDLAEIRDRLDTDDGDDGEREAHIMHQMNAKTIGTLSVVATVSFWIGTLAPL
jgi:predicted DNA-binding protein